MAIKTLPGPSKVFPLEGAGVVPGAAGVPVAEGVPVKVTVAVPAVDDRVGTPMTAEEVVVPTDPEVEVLTDTDEDVLCLPAEETAKKATKMIEAAETFMV